MLNICSESVNKIFIYIPIKMEADCKFIVESLSGVILNQCYSTIDKLRKRYHEVLSVEYKKLINRNVVM